jgi:hypothetical protein
MAKGYNVRDEHGNVLFVINARDTKHAKTIAKRRGTDDEPTFKFSVIIDIDLPGYEDKETVTSSSHGQEQRDWMRERNENRRASISDMTNLVKQLQKHTALYWVPAVKSRFHIENHLGPFTHQIQDERGRILLKKDVTFWSFDYFDHRIEVLRRQPILYITEHSNNGECEYGLSEDKWETVIHRKLCGIISRQAFDEMVELLELRIDCLDTMGMLGAPGAEPWYGSLPAVALGGDADGGIISVYACPMPIDEKDELWLLQGHTREEVAASEELQKKMWKRAQQFFEDYSNWW